MRAFAASVRRVAAAFDTRSEWSHDEQLRAAVARAIAQWREEEDRRIRMEKELTGKDADVGSSTGGTR